VARDSQTEKPLQTKQNKSNPAPHYGSLVPPLSPTLRAGLTAGDCTHPLVSLRSRSLTIDWSRPECRKACFAPYWRLSRRPFYDQIYKMEKLKGTFIYRL
jgi:hypothetical protein